MTKYIPPHRRLRARQASHADDWLMTYADMITLLLCFFVVFAAMGAVHQKKQASMNVPVAVQEEAAPVAAVALPPAAPLPPPSASIERALARLSNDPTGLVSPEPEAPVAAPKAAEAAVEPPPVPPPAPPETVAPAAPAEVAALQAQGATDVAQQGDRISSFEISNASFFDNGSAKINEAGQKILKDVAATLKDDKYKDYQITVEGHTDDSPVKTAQFPSNWELSSTRAAAVVRYFLEQGLPALRLRAAGYADTFPKVPNRDAAGHPIPANQAQNRRVVIRVEKIEGQ